MTEQALSDRYEVQRQLGKRAGQQTLLARDRITQDLVVIKLLKFGDDFEWEQFKLFEREAQTLQHLSHPAIPRYLDSFEVDSRGFRGFALVQAYIDAPSLEDHLKVGRTFSEAEVKQIARSVLGILSHLHEQQPPVIHRDIKPGNVLLAGQAGDPVGSVYLVDFGSVQTLAAATTGTMTVVGTYGYMPPEQFGGRAVPASDLYSLGATLLYLVTGCHPADLPQQELRLQFESYTTVSPSFQRWLRRMTEPSLDRRFTTAQAALSALDQPSEIVSLVSQQPGGSKVVLEKDSEAIRITLPSAGFSTAMGFLILFSTAWNSFVAFWTWMAFFETPLPINLIAAVFALPFWFVGISMVSTALFSIFGQTQLQIDQQQVALLYRLFGFKFRRTRPSPRSIIDRLEHRPRSLQKDATGDRIEVPPTLTIWAGAQKYELGSQCGLTEPELNWLAAELSEWLGLPLSTNGSGYI